MPKQQLSLPEKLQLLSDLRDFYIKDFGIIYDDIPEELGRLKGLSIGFVLDSVKTLFKGIKDPTKEEIILVLTNILTKDFLDVIYSNRNEAEVCFMKSGFGCALAVLIGNKKVINIERKELEKTGGIEINCSLL